MCIGGGHECRLDQFFGNFRNPIIRAAGLKIYNAFNTGNERDVQNNITSPDDGKFYTPIQRSIGFAFGLDPPLKTR